MTVVQMILEAVAAALALAQPASAEAYHPPTAAERCRSATAAPDDRWLSAPTVDGTRLAGRAALAALVRGGRVVVDGGNFRGADLRGLRLGDVCFVDADFSGSDWRRARAVGLVLVGGSLTGANLSGADLRAIVLENLGLDDVDLSGARLAAGRIVGGGFLSLERLRLARADLSSFVFDCGITIDDSCPVAELLDLRGADLSHAQLAAYWGLIDATGARVNGTRIGIHQLRELAGAALRGPVIVGAGDAAAEFTPEEYRRVVGWVRDPAEEEADFAPGRPPSWLRPGAVALFVDLATPIDPAFHADPLYRRLVPVMAASAGARVVVTVNADGSVDAVGDAIGGNAHLCSLAAERLRLDAATGWYAGPYAPSGDEPAEWARVPMPVLRFWADRAEVYQNGHSGYGEGLEARHSDYASCGARAGFAALQRLPVTEAEARAVAATLVDPIG